MQVIVPDTKTIRYFDYFLNQMIYVMKNFMTAFSNAITKNQFYFYTKLIDKKLETPTLKFYKISSYTKFSPINGTLKDKKRSK